MKPDCVPGARLCQSVFIPGPSGYKWRHSFQCPARPGEPIRAKDYVGSQGTKQPWSRKR